jgi:hypothetical protein
MDIRSALSELLVIERSLVITDPVNMSVKRVWNYSPPVSVALPDVPAFTNAWTMQDYTRPTFLVGSQAGAGSSRNQQYAIHMQFYAGLVSAEADRLADIATAFHVAFMDALDAAGNLNGTVMGAVPRGGDPTLGLLERGGKPYVGLDLYLDVLLYD